MKLVMVGGHSRNIGKTSVVEGIIRAIPDAGWTAIKITQYGHGVCSASGEDCDCVVSEHEFTITPEHERTSGTDTARFLAAGAKRSLWVRTRQGDLFSVIGLLKKEIENDPFVIVESNSLRRFIKPDVYLQVLDPNNPDFKSSAQEFFDLADAYLVVDGESDSAVSAPSPLQRALLAREISHNKPLFTVSASDQFINQSIIDFVQASLKPVCR